MGPRVQSLAHCVCVFAAFAAAWPEATRADGSNCESIPQSSCLSDWPSPQLTVPAGIAIASPISVKPSDAGLAASTSLSTWRDYNANHLSKKVELSLGQGAFVMVRPPQVSLPLDIWTRVQMAGLDGDADRDVQIAAGADYRFSRLANLGVSTTFADSSVATGASPEAAAQDTVGAYANIKLLPALNMEARGQWVSPGDGAERDSVASEASLSIAPRVSQRYMLEGGTTVEPYVTLRNELYAEGEKAFIPSAGGGITIDKPQGYSLSISTMVDSVEEADRAQVNSRIQLKVPIP